MNTLFTKRSPDLATAYFRARSGLTGLLIAGAFGLPVTTAWAQNVMPPTPPEVSFTIKRFVIVGTNPLGEAASQEVLRPYLGAHSGLARLQDAAQALEARVNTTGGLYRVVLPPQETIDSIELRIEPINISNVTISGNKFHNEANIRGAVPGLRENANPNMRVIARQLAIANDNGTKITNMRLSESIGGGIDANLEVTDSNVWRGLVALNNTGTRNTGRYRLLGVLQNTNLFNRDHTMSLAYTTSPEDVSGVKQFGVYYRAPLYDLGGVITASASYSSVNSGALGTGQTITGRGTTTGIQYTHHFLPQGPLRATASLGIDDKMFRAPTIGGIVIPIGDVRSQPVSVGFNLRYLPGGMNGYFGMTYARNTGWGNNNSDAVYAANRLGARSDWDALRMSYGATVTFGSGWLFNFAGQAQFSDEPLINGEQFGIGGAQSVRGFLERAVVGESGHSVSFEVWTPDVAPNLRFLGFVDAGQVKRRMPPVGTNPQQSISSTGLGLRYQFGARASMSVDFAHVLQGSTQPGVTNGSNRIHANFLLRFE